MHYDAIVIGGGLYGCSLALHLRRTCPRVLLLERGVELLLGASYANQARVHNGYHYPRSILTALRSRVNFARFLAEHDDCLDRSFQQYYAVGRRFSGITSVQFQTFCRRIGAALMPAPPAVRRLFDADLVEDVFLVEECAFDAVRLRRKLSARLDAAGVDVRLRTEATRVETASGHLRVTVAGVDGGRDTVSAHRVFNCVYSHLNHLLAASALPLIPLRHEVTEMALVAMPPPLDRVGVTLMDGPFFSFMPFPPRGLHTLSHVRYTPHGSWLDQGTTAVDPRVMLDAVRGVSNGERMLRDARRYMPVLRDCRQVDSLWEVKTLLPASEGDDSRPIVFRPDHGLKNFTCVLGAKIDNVFDLLDVVDATCGAEVATDACV